VNNWPALIEAGSNSSKLSRGCQLNNLICCLSFVDWLAHVVILRGTSEKILARGHKS
jgi:hypothetical protein